MKEMPELSVVVPVLNETATLPALFASLGSQRDVALEVILSDGGSTDGTPDLAHLLAKTATFPVIVVSAPRGRGRQLNTGAASSHSKVLLFLHADSAFPDDHALRRALDTMDAAVTAHPSGRVAGHFALTFARTRPDASFAYYYFECKARLNRHGCIHGDQGMLLTRSYFKELTGFDESVPVNEDTLFAQTVSRTGAWVLLPASLLTSARRFETEGLLERQTLNAIIMNLAAQDRYDFLRSLPRAYPCHDRTRRLDLFPVLAAASRLIADLPLSERLSLWKKTGNYVRANAWQLAFAADCRRNFRKQLEPGDGSTPWLAFYDRRLDAITAKPPGRLTATVLTWLWFRLTLFVLGLFRRNQFHEDERGHEGQSR